MNRRHFLTTTAAAGLATLSGCGRSDYDFELLNVSYDPTRELYRKINHMFTEDYLQKTGKKVRAAVARRSAVSPRGTTAPGRYRLARDVDRRRFDPAQGLIEGWEKRYPNPSIRRRTSRPSCSSVRNNPFGIRDWPDLLDPPQNPFGRDHRSSQPEDERRAAERGRAWLDVLTAGSGPRREFVTRVQRVPVLDTGARATTTFARRTSATST